MKLMCCPACDYAPPLGLASCSKISRKRQVHTRPASLDKLDLNADVYVLEHSSQQEQDGKSGACRHCGPVRTDMALRFSVEKGNNLF